VVANGYSFLFYRNIRTDLVGHECGYGATDFVVLLVVARWPEQYEHEPGRYRYLGNIAEQSRFL